MGKVTRNYEIVCPSCRGTGWIDHPTRVSSAATMTCPTCNGSKKVLVTEVVDEQ